MRIHALLQGTAAALLICAPVASHAQAVSAPGLYKLSIPSEPLGDALNELAQQSGLQLLYSSQLVAGLTCPPLKGSLSAEQALRRLLSSTHLRFEFVNPHTIAILDGSNLPLTSTAPQGGSKQRGEAGVDNQNDIGKSNASTEPAQAAAASALRTTALATQNSANNAQATVNTELTEVTVTGSRVITNGNDSPTPLTVISTAQMMELQPTTVIDALNLMPALQGSQSNISSPGGPQRNGAAAYINLRDMGALRTLILYDGQRVVATINQQEGQVDSNVIPELLLQRVDVVTGGVSAVYGSDAVSGVVNFITDTKFNGVKVNANTGLSTYGDDQIYDVGIAAGSNLFDGRGHGEFSYEYHDDPGIFNRLTRPFFARDLGAGGAGTAASPYYDVPNERLSNTSFGGLITGGPLKGHEFTQNGIVSPFVNGTMVATNVQSGGDGGWFPNASIKSQLVFHQLFGRFDYDITDTIHGHLQIAAADSHTSDDFESPNFSVNIGYNNPFLASIQQPYQGQLSAQAALTPTGSFSFARILLNTPYAEQHTDTYMVMGGLDGSIASYKWQVGFGHSESDLQDRDNYNINMGNFYAATNAVVNPATNQIICHAAMTNAIYANCVPLNLFGPTSQSAAALQYISQDTVNQNRTMLDDINASITGAPIKSWAGAVNMALSAEGRRTGWSVSSNVSSNQFVNCSGIQFSCTQDTTMQWQFGIMPGNPLVSQNVGEIAYETDVPLAKDLPFMRALDFTGALRETRYTNSGQGYSSAFDATTWKLGLDWHINDELTVRATRSRDIRAPNLFELYAPTTTGTATLNDPHTGVVAPLYNVTQSDPNLVPEVAATWTAGIIYRPIPRLSLSVDAFHITVDKEIFLLSGTAAAVSQTCDASGGTSPVCALIVRPLPFSNTTQANFPTRTMSEYLNIASLETYGADFEANYSATVVNRPLTLRALASYQPHLILNQGPAGIIDYGDSATGAGLVTATPSFKYTLIGQYSITDQFTVSVLEKGRNSMKVTTVPGLVLTHPYDPSIAYTDLTLSYTQKSDVGQTELYFNIQNLFNSFPSVYYPGAIAAPGAQNNIPQGDDPVGRYYMIGFRFRH